MKRLYLMDDTTGTKYELIKVGDPEDFMYGSPKYSTCGDCGAKVGDYHKVYCDIQRCPICKGQLLSCDHAEFRLYMPRHTGQFA